MSVKAKISGILTGALVAGFLVTSPVQSFASSQVLAGGLESSSVSISPANFEPVGANVAIVEVRATSVVVSWSLPAEAEISKIDMAHYNYSNQQWTGLPTSTEKSGQLTITGLTPNTGYAYRTHTFYVGGQSRLGDIQFRTSNAFEPVGATVALVEATTTSAVLSWSLPEEAVINRVEMAHYNYSTQQWTTLPTSTNKSGQITITGLTPETGYAFRTNTRYASGVSKLGDIQFETMSTRSRDLQLPVLVPESVSVSSSTVAPGGQISGQFRVTDDVGCCSWVRIDMRTATPFADRDKARIWTMMTPRQVSGTATNATFSGAITVPSSTPAGTYMLYGQAKDNFDRWTHLVVLGSFEVRAVAQNVAPTLSVSDVQSRSATASWSIPDETPTTSMRLQIQEVAVGSWSPLSLSGPNLKSGRAVLALKPGTDYRVRMVATYTDGTTKSDLVSFSTTALVQPPRPVIEIDNSTPDVAAVTWRYSFSSLEKFVISIREAGGSDVPLDLARSARSHRFAGLKPNTQYIITLEAVANSGASASTNVALFTPAKVNVEPAKPSITQINEGQTSVEITFAQPSLQGADAVQRWDVQVRQAGDSAWSTAQRVVNDGSNRHTVTVSSLAPGGSYQVRVVARAETGSTSVSAVSNFQTSAGIAAPRSLSTRDITWNSAVFTWSQAISGAGTIPARYQIEIMEEGSRNWRAVRTFSSSDRRPSVTVSGLKAGTLYQWRVLAVSRSGSEEMSYAESFSTPSSMRSPSSITVSDVSDTWARVTWAYIANRAFKPVASFEIRVSEDQGATWTSLVSGIARTARAVTIRDLSPETDYDLRVVAISSDGEEAYDAITIVTNQNLEEISEVTVSLISSRSATIKWVLPEPGLGGQALRSVAVQTKSGKKWVTRARNVSPGQLQARIGNLNPGTRYTYRVVSVGQDGARDFSKPKRFTTR